MIKSFYSDKNIKNFIKDNYKIDKEEFLNEKKDNILEDVEKLESYEEFEKQLFSTSQEFNKNSFQVLQDNKNYWSVGLSGICPVSCSEMGREDKCCAKCKYWITGVPFLIGQTTELNDLMFNIRQKAKKVQKLNLKYIDSFSELIKGEIELINEEMQTMIGEWSLRYNFVVKSLDLLNNKKDDNSNSNLITKNNKLNLGIEKGNDFGIAFNICKNNELIDEFENNEAQFELELFINKILMHNNVEPFLFKLEREDSLKVSNIFSEYILKNYNEKHIESLIQGKMKLNDDKIEELNNLLENTQNQIEYKGNK